MRKSRFTEEQIVAALRQAEAGTPVEEITRKLLLRPSRPSMRTLFHFFATLMATHVNLDVQSPRAVIVGFLLRSLGDA